MADNQRKTIILPAMGGRDPITSAARIGSLLCSSSIPGMDPATGHVADGPEAQFDLAFRNARALLDQAGLSTDEVGQLTVFIPDQSYRQYINAPWLEMFPNENRPARKTTHAGLPEGQVVQLQLFAVAGGSRQPLGIPGIAHRDPLPMGVSIGDLIFSSVLGPDIPGSDQRPATAAAQIEQTFANMRAFVEQGGATADDIGLVWAYLGDFESYPDFLDVWLQIFPRDGDRPSRKTFSYDLGGRMTFVQAQCIAVVGGDRTNFEVEGIGHHDPIPLGARKGDYFFTSGISGNSPETGKLADGAEAQMQRAMENLSVLIGHAGGSLDNIVQVTALLADVSYAKSVETAWTEIFPNPDDRPALHVMKLGLPGRDTLVQVHAMGAF